MIAILVVAALAVLALAYVAAPIAMRRRMPAQPSEPEVAREASERRDSALGALLDIEEEREIGKLSEADFEALRRQYEADALAALRELDALTTAPDDPLESEIARMRERLRCPRCGSPRGRGEGCARCGAP